MFRPLLRALRLIVVLSGAVEPGPRFVEGPDGEWIWVRLGLDALAGPRVIFLSGQCGLSVPGGLHVASVGYATHDFLVSSLGASPAIPANAARRSAWRAGAAVGAGGVTKGHACASRCRALSTSRFPFPPEAPARRPTLTTCHGPPTRPGMGRAEGKTLARAFVGEGRQRGRTALGGCATRARWRLGSRPGCGPRT